MAISSSGLNIMVHQDPTKLQNNNTKCSSDYLHILHVEKIALVLNLF